MSNGQSETVGIGMKDQVVLRTVSRLMIPFIILFALYVIFHGEGGPGGGFQGGVIIGGAVALYGIINGRAAARYHLHESFWDALCGIGVSVYAGIGFVCVLLGGKMLQYDTFAPWFGATPGAEEGVQHHAVQHANHYGVFGVEMGVAITVTAVMITLYFEMSRPDHAERQESAP